MSDVKALVIGAHIDECEFGMGGTARLLTEAGARVKFVNVAAYLHYDPKTTPKERIAAQSEAAAKTLGVEKTVWDNVPGSAWVCTQERILRIAEEIEAYQPELLFIQWPRDNHFEHVEVAQASYKAFSHASGTVRSVKEVYAFEAGAFQTEAYFPTDFAVDIGAARPVLDDCLRCFAWEKASGEALIRDKDTIAALRGFTHGCRFAEAFKIVKFPDGSDDFLMRHLLADAFRWSGRLQYPAYGREFF